MAGELPRRKAWRHQKVVSEHAFDKLRLLDCTFGEFDAAIIDAEVIEDRSLDDERSPKELSLSVAWRRAPHVHEVPLPRRPGMGVANSSARIPEVASPAAVLTGLILGKSKAALAERRRRARAAE